MRWLEGWFGRVYVVVDVIVVAVVAVFVGGVEVGLLVLVRDGIQKNSCCLEMLAGGGKRGKGM